MSSISETIEVSELHLLLLLDRRSVASLVILDCVLRVVVITSRSPLVSKVRSVWDACRVNGRALVRDLAFHELTLWGVTEAGITSAKVVTFCLREK
jgi:hypothetical protein